MLPESFDYTDKDFDALRAGAADHRSRS